MNYDEKQLFRLIANPYRLNKESDFVETGTDDDLLDKYLKITYKKEDIYINPSLLKEIKHIIDDKIKEHIIQEISNDIVNQSIENVLQKFDLHI
jgi:protein required for attachment to host cells